MASTSSVGSRPIYTCKIPACELMDGSGQSVLPVSIIHIMTLYSDTASKPR